MNKKVGVKFFIKLFAKVLFAVLLIYGFTQAAFSIVEDSLWEMKFSNDVAGMLNRCDEYLIQEEYGTLWENLELYDLYDSQYDIYWESVEDRYNELQDEQWERAMQD